MLLVGGGSNLVVADEGFAGRVVVVRNEGISVEADTCGGAFVEIGAGESWDDVVAHGRRSGWVGIEALSGIPGTTGATPIQNVGAYGQEVGQTHRPGPHLGPLLHGRPHLRRSRLPIRLPHQPVQARPRPLRGARRHLPAPLGDLGAPVQYAELAAALGVELGERAPTPEVREAVLAAAPRQGDGPRPGRPRHLEHRVVLHQPGGPGRRRARRRAGVAAARRPVKTSAAWLIEHAGFAKGYGTDRVRLSSKHTLALTNRGGASTAELLALARELRDGVQQRFGITLVNEPVLVGCSL